MRAALTLCLLAAAAVAQVNPPSLGWVDDSETRWLVTTESGRGENYAPNGPFIAVSSSGNAAWVPALGRHIVSNFVSNNVTPADMRHRGPCTYGGWTYRATSSSQSVVFQNGNPGTRGWDFGTAANGSGAGRFVRLAYGGVDNQALLNSVQVDLGKWHQIVFVATNATHQGVAYLNGDFLTTNETTSTPLAPTSASKVYQYSTDTTNAADHSFYIPRALTAAEVQQLYQSQRRFFP